MLPEALKPLFSVKHLTRQMVWICAILILASVVMWKGLKLSHHSQRIAVEVMERQVLDTMNAYKNKWLVSGKPESLEVDERQIYFSAQGWPYEVDSQLRLNCAATLEMLTRGKLEANQQAQIESERITPGRCRYRAKPDFELDYEPANLTSAVTLVH